MKDYENAQENIILNPYYICKISKSHFIIVFLQKSKRLSSKNHYGEFFLR